MLCYIVRFDRPLIKSVSISGGDRVLAYLPAHLSADEHKYNADTEAREEDAKERTRLVASRRVASHTARFFIPSSSPPFSVRRYDPKPEVAHVFQLLCHRTAIG